MVCRNCNRILPDGTTYCLYCGTPAMVDDLPATVPVGSPRPEAAKPQPPVRSAPVPAPPVPPVRSAPVPTPPAPPAPKSIPVANIPVNPTPPAYQPPKAPAVTAAVEKPVDKKALVPIAALAVAVILVVVLGISNRNLKKQLSASPEVNTAQSTEVQDDSALIAELEKTVAEQELALADQQALVDALQQDSDLYNAMKDALNNNPAGYATHYFQANQTFLVVKNGNTNSSFTLTAHWENGGSADMINVDYSSDCARLYFDRETWYTTANITVIPQKPGFTVATFSNDKDDNTFCVLILVLD